MNPARVARRGRRTARRIMQDTCVVWRRQSGVDEFGSSVDGWVAVDQPAEVLNGDGELPCRVDAPGNQPWEAEAAEQVKAYTMYLLSLPIGADIAAADRVEHRGRFLEVSARKSLTTYDIDTRAICVEVAGGKQ